MRNYYVLDTEEMKIKKSFSPYITFYNKKMNILVQ